MLYLGIDTWYANEASAFSVAPSIIPNSKLPGQTDVFGGAADLYLNGALFDLPAHVPVEEGQKAGGNLKADALLLSRLQRHAAESRQLLYRSGHLRIFVPQIELHHLVSGEFPSVFYHARDL